MFGGVEIGILVQYQEKKNVMHGDEACMVSYWVCDHLCDNGYPIPDFPMSTGWVGNDDEPNDSQQGTILLAVEEEEEE